MREKLLFDFGWSFHDGDVDGGIPLVKGYHYNHAKTERALGGPAAVNYGEFADKRLERWERVDLPHDYIIRQAPQPENPDSLGYFDYHNAWYRKQFRLDGSDWKTLSGTVNVKPQAHTLHYGVLTNGTKTPIQVKDPVFKQ